MNVVDGIFHIGWIADAIRKPDPTLVEPESPIRLMGCNQFIEYLKCDLLPVLSLKKLSLIEFRTIGQVKAGHEIPAVQLGHFR